MPDQNVLGLHGSDSRTGRMPAVVPLAWLATILVAGAWVGAQVDDAPADITVTGRSVVINGIDHFAPGMFGVHASGLTDQQMSDWGIEADRKIHPAPLSSNLAPRDDRLILHCLFDRYQPALQLSDRNWRDTLTQIATRIGTKPENQTAAKPLIEFWNEPFLNWSVRPGVNYDGDHYDTSRAVEGGQVHYRGSDEPIPDLVWTRGLIAVRAEGGQKDYLAWGYMPRTVAGEDGKQRDIRAGDTYVFRGRDKMIVKDHWLVKDISQKSYWAGKHNARLYNQMLSVFAPALKSASPDATLVAGWDFHLYQGNWDAWKTCYKPTIDAAQQWIDGVSEHHYGGDTRLVAVSYEVAVGYTRTTYGKWIRGYNTEAGGNLDPQRPDTVTYGQQPDAQIRAISAMTYHLRDVIYLLCKMPEKAAFRAAHEASHTGGDEFAFKLLKELRGKIIDVQARADDVWTVASLDEKNKRLSIVLFNDAPAPRTLTLAVNAPAGTNLVKGTQRNVASVAAKPYLTIIETPIDAAAAKWRGKITLDPKSAIALRFELSGEPTATAQSREQYFAKDFLKRIEIGQPTTLTIDLPPEALSAGRAVMRVVSSASIPADIVAQFNGQSIAIPAASGVLDIPINPAWLKASNKLIIHPGAMSFDIASVSLYTIHE